MAQTPEGRVKDKLKKMMRRYQPDLYWFCPVQQGYGAAGLDFHCVYRGRAFFVETKASPHHTLSKRQCATRAQAVDAGAPAFIVYDQETIDKIETWILKIKLATSASAPNGRPSSSETTRVSNPWCPTNPSSEETDDIF